MSTIDDSLAEADAAMEAQLVKPEASELEAIKAFCTIQLERRKATEAVAESLKLEKGTAKNDKAVLMRLVKSSGHKSAMLSKTQMARLEAITAAEGLESVPPYARIVAGNKDATITPEIIKEALEAVTPEDLEEAAKTAGTFLEAVKAAALQQVRNGIRSYSEVLRLNSSLERGSSVYETPELSDDAADLMLRIWRAEQRAKALGVQKKAALEGSSEKLKALEPRIDAFFVRTGTTSQRIVVESTPFRLVRRISVRKPRLGIGKVELFLTEVLTSFGAIESASQFQRQAAAIIKQLQTKLTSVPPETKTSIGLCSVKQQQQQQ